MSLSTVDTIDDTLLTRPVPSIFRSLRRNSFIETVAGNALRDDFIRMISGEPTVSGAVRLGEVRHASRMVVNHTQKRTLASVSWQEDGRVYAASFLLEDPLPYSIIDLSNSLR